MKTKILLTGGKGFFCSRFADYYKDRYDILAAGREELDITDKESVDRCIGEFKPDIIIHAGAIAVTDYCNQHPDIAHKINVEASVDIARAAKKNGSKLVFISSEQVFNGNKNPGPFKEDDEAVPNTVYGENKLEAEGLLKEILEELWIVRFTWLFGMPERGKNMSNGILWETMTKLMRQEKIVASKREFRGMTDVYEMVENFPKLFDLPYGTYHLGAPNDESRYDVVKGILCELGLGDHIDQFLEEDTVKYQDKNRDVRLDVSKAESCGMKWSVTSEALKKCLQEYGIRL